MTSRLSPSFSGVFLSLHLLAAVLFCGLAVGCKREDVVIKSYQGARKLGAHKVSYLRTKGISDAFVRHIASFESYYGGSIGDITVRFGKVDSFAACEISWLGRKEIVVNRPMWEEFSQHPQGDERKEILIFHELGHCVLGQLEHRNERFSADAIINDRPVKLDVPTSIMKAVVSNADLDIIVRYRDAYLKELFDRIPVNQSIGLDSSIL